MGFIRTRFRKRKCSSLPKIPLFFGTCTIIIVTYFGPFFLFIYLSSVDPPSRLPFPTKSQLHYLSLNTTHPKSVTQRKKIETPPTATCATVEEMGDDEASLFSDVSGKESLRVRSLIRDHFALHGATRVRGLPPEQFCRQGFVMGKASEAGFGNEMYKILTAAGLSIMLNRSLIIGQTRHIGSFQAFLLLLSINVETRSHVHTYPQMRAHTDICSLKS